MVGGYVIDGELGRGGMGVVYCATHPVIGKRAAIKVLKPFAVEQPDTVERFIQEARAVNQIGHPNIVDIFAFGKLPDGRATSSWICSRRVAAQRASSAARCTRARRRS